MCRQASNNIATYRSSVENTFYKGRIDTEIPVNTDNEH